MIHTYNISDHIMTLKIYDNTMIKNITKICGHKPHYTNFCKN